MNGEFSEETKRILAKRAGEKCSLCGTGTSKPHTDTYNFINLGEAAHIRGNKKDKFNRYDETMTDAERSNIANGIWLCRGCHKEIDRDDKKYTVALLISAKTEHEQRVETGYYNLNTSASAFLIQQKSDEKTPSENVATLSDDQIIEQFYTASSDLLTWPATFERLGDYHIERAETTSLLKWIEEPLTQDPDSNELTTPVAVLVGGAGYGKTTVLRDLLQQLHQQRIPVIGLKADRLMISHRNDLEQELRLSDHIDVLVKRLSKGYERIVVIVDQLDALSQSLSADRQILYVFDRLIEQLAMLPHTRIVVSCRQFDLEYDPALKQYKKKHIVSLTPLSDADVKEVLKQIGLPEYILTPKLYDLLKVPLHLDIFCKVYREVADISSLATVQDLYHEIWRQKIASIPNTAIINSIEVCTTVQKIASQMYDRQQISLPYRPFESSHKSVIDYLNSQSLITLSESKIQFFHQSFFDYVFARTFVDQGLSISADIVSTNKQVKHQGLFIRSRVRQVLAYLREVDEQMYADEITTILTGEEHRFHIKLLTLQLLAFQKDPLPIEQSLLSNTIRTNQLLWEIFIETVASRNWFRYITVHFAKQYLTQETMSAKGRVYHLCRRVQSHSPDLIAEFLDQLPSFTDRNEFISSVLFVLEDFSSPVATKLFEQVLPIRQRDELWFYHVMQQAIQTQPNWVSAQIKQRILTGLDNIPNDTDACLPVERDGHQFLETLEKLYEKDPNLAFDDGLILLKALISKAPLSWQEKLKSKIRSDKPFWHFVPEDQHHDAEDGLMLNLRSWLLELIKKDKFEGLKLISELLWSDFASIISLALHGVIYHPEECAAMFFARLKSPFFLEEYAWANHQYFGYSVERSLQLCFPYFDNLQQQTIIECILTLNPRQEYWLHEYRKLKAFWSTGRLQYTLVNMLPSEVVEEQTALKARYLQLYRKFGEHKHAKPRGAIVTVGGTVLADSAYRNMTDADWLNSFTEYSIKKDKRWDGVDELSHAQRFTEEVKQNPSYYVGLIETLIDRNDLPDLYVYHGLEGLEQADFDLEKFQKLFLKCISRTIDDHYQSRLVWLTEYFVKKENYSQIAFEYLAVIATRGSQKSNIDNGLLTAGINQPRGAAIHRLYNWIAIDSFRERIFQVMEQVTVDGLLTTRAVAITDQAHFNRYDQQRSLRLFIALSEGNEVELAEHTIQSLQYNIHIDFVPLIPFFERSIEASKAQHGLTQILMVAYKYDYSGSDVLLEQYLQTGADAINGALDVAMPGLMDEDESRRERCRQIVYRFLDSTEKVVNQAYLGAFRHFEVKDFEYLHAFLKDYANSRVGRFRDYEFYQYLLKCVNKYPKECLALAVYFDQHLDPDTFNGYLRNEPIEVVLQAYNTFQEYRYPSADKELAMDVFDRMLQNPAYRDLMNQIVSKLD